MRAPPHARHRLALRLRFFAAKAAEDAILRGLRGRRPGPAAAAGAEALRRIHRGALAALDRLPEPPARPPSGRRPGGLGVRRLAAVIVGPGPDWAARFAEEAALIRDFLGGACLRIHHIGSTAVPGLAAKPILDLALELPAEGFGEHLDRAFAGLARLGYRFRGDRRRQGGRFFERVCDGARTHAIQLHRAGSEDLADVLRFRDRLRGDPALAAAYERVKAALAAAIGDDRRIYMWYKSHWINERMLAESGRPWGEHLLAVDPPTLRDWYFRRPGPGAAS
jgi:GrpB-like predicted nucleotidyltransferase (UPF0157 family)